MLCATVVSSSVPIFVLPATVIVMTGNTYCATRCWFNNSVDNKEEGHEQICLSAEAIFLSI